MIELHQSCAPKPLEGERYAKLYNIRRNASSMTSSAVEWLCSSVPTFLPRRMSPPNIFFNILSVGAGCGDVDLPLLSKLLTNTQQPCSLSYTALEPIEHDRVRLTEALRSLKKQKLKQPSKNNCSTFEFSVLPDAFENFDSSSSQRFDLILFCHVMYYFPNPLRTIQRAINLLTPGFGNLLIIHNTPVGVPEIEAELMPLINDNNKPLISSAKIENALRDINANFELLILNSVLNMPEDPTEFLDVISFCLETDLSALPATNPLVVRAREEFANRMSEDKVLKEPISVFRVRAAAKPTAEILHKAERDADKVSDYRELAQQLDWSCLLQTAKKALDIGSGRGRLISALETYVAIDHTHSCPVVDAIDPDEAALKLYMQNLPPKLFSRGEAMATFAQEAEIAPASYDVVWSMHSMYGVPRGHLPSVIYTALRALTSDGVGLIAMPTRDSSYVFLHRTHAEAHKKKSQVSCRKDSETQSSEDEQENSFELQTELTNYTDVIKCVRSLRVPHRIRTIFYEERVAADDVDALTEYVVRESMSNCFAVDDDERREQNFLAKEPSFAQLLQIPEFVEVVQPLRRGGAYYFPQEVKVVTFGKNRSVVEALPASFGPMCSE